jgi:rfaE bifunctional protein nucleotidyltransferase chain/domain
MTTPQRTAQLVDAPVIEHLRGRSGARPHPVRDKVKSIDDLAVIAARARNANETVVLCHGVFDLLHIGHIRHLESAKRLGSVLIVTLTDDANVNKGPDRPVFEQGLRAEMIAALGFVDWVAINDTASAVDLLARIKPDFYVKGPDYKDADDDVTGNIERERNTVEAHGGQIVFTADIAFSSSHLINRHLNLHEPELRDYLAGLRANGGLTRLTELIDSVKDMKVLFVGDAIIDEYQYVSPIGKSAKENMIATLAEDREIFAGGVFAAANHVATFCQQVDIVTSLGDADAYEDIIADSLRANIDLHVVRRPGTPTTRKTRFVDTGYGMRKLFELYTMDDRPLDDAQEAALNEMIAARIADYDVVIVTDFGHGLLSPQTRQLVMERASFLAVNAQSNAANHGYNLITKYARADYICIDGTEARLAVQNKFATIPDITDRHLPRLVACTKIIVTHGKQGCYAYAEGAAAIKIPALTKTVIDTVGAGDAFFAVSAPFVAAGASIADAGFLGNIAGAVQVGIVGHRNSVEKTPFVKFLSSLLA